MDDGKLIEFLEATENRTLEYFQRWLKKPEFKNTLHGYDHVISKGFANTERDSGS